MKKGIILVVIIFTIFSCGYFLVRSLDTLKRTQKPEIISEQKNDFKKKGTIVVNGAQSSLNLVYEDPGAPALSVKLKFREKSVCGDENFETLCFAISQTFEDFFSGKQALVEGLRDKDGSVLISRIIRLRAEP